MRRLDQTFWEIVSPAAWDINVRLDHGFSVHAMSAVDSSQMQDHLP